MCFYSGLIYYYPLGNVHSELRSALCSIQLMSIAKYSTVEKSGYNKLLEPLVDAVLRLEQVCVPNFCLFMFTPYICRKVFCSSLRVGTSCIYVALLLHFLWTILLPGCRWVQGSSKSISEVVPCSTVWLWTARCKLRWVLN